MIPNESEIGHFAGLQLQLELIGNQGDEFRIRGFALTFILRVAKLIINRELS